MSGLGVCSKCSDYEPSTAFKYAILDRSRQLWQRLLSNNRHVGFGFGGHICLGIHLARMEMNALWNAIIPPLKKVELAGTPCMAESEFVCGPKSIPIRFEMDCNRDRSSIAQKGFEGFRPTLYEHLIGCFNRLALGIRAPQRLLRQVVRISGLQ